MTLVYAGEGGYTDQAGRLKALRGEFGLDCFDIIEGDDGLDFWRRKRTEWFDRHAANAQTSFYRSHEPAGA